MEAAAPLVAGHRRVGAAPARAPGPRRDRIGRSGRRARRVGHDLSRYRRPKLTGMPDENLPATAGGPVPPPGPQPRSALAGAGQAPGGTGPTRGHAGERDGVVNGDSAPIVVGPVDAMTHEYEMPPSPAAGWRDRAPDATGDDPAPDDRWPDEELIPERPPIASHRRLTGRHGSRIGATILGLLLAAAVGTIALRGWAASGSPDAGDQPLPYPADTVPAGPALLPDESLGAPTASTAESPVAGSPPPRVAPRDR